MDRVILHIDMNNFYASVETLYDPSLKDIPMAVGGDKERRHGIVLAVIPMPSSSSIRPPRKIKVSCNQGFGIY